jgi:CheY-like chemotaxis protein
METLEGKGTTMWFDIALGFSVSCGGLLSGTTPMCQSSPLFDDRGSGAPGPEASRAESMTGMTTSKSSKKRSRPKATVLPALLPETCVVAVVDDAEINRKIMTRTLSKYGVNYVLCCDGQECVDTVVARAGSSPINVILMDINMPVLNGLEATHALRQLGFTVPIIAVTGNAMNHQIEMCKSAGMIAVLTKPFNEEQLLRELLNALEPHHADPPNTGAEIIASSPSYSTSGDPRLVTIAPFQSGGSTVSKQ